MSDKTISFKIDEGTLDKAQGLIKSSGITNKEWFSRAVAMAEMQSIKDGATDYASDLSELEVHTTRIYELINNMMQKSIYLKEDAVNTLEQQLGQQREMAADYHAKIKTANDERDQALQDTQLAQSEQKQLEEQLEEIREVLETNRLLVDEYKNKNDVLNGLVAKYEGYANDNEKLKITLANEQQSHQSQLADLTHNNAQYIDTINKLEQQLDSQQNAHEDALNHLSERMELEKDKAILKAERQHQDNLSKANEVYNQKIQSLYDNMDKQRKSYDDKISELQQQLANVKKDIK